MSFLKKASALLPEISGGLPGDSCLSGAVMQKKPEQKKLSVPAFIGTRKIISSCDAAV